jgi:predicted phosphodiesterase
MRIVLLSDIHGNLVSLEAVLADVARQGADQIVCLGDVASLGPQPGEVIARLRALDCLCVMGNHDLELLDLDSALDNIDGPPLIVAVLVEWSAWCAGQLSKADLAYLRSFQPLIEIPLDAKATLLCFHGSPRSNADFVFITTPDAELDTLLAGHTATVMAGGHTHVQAALRRYNDVTLVNAGSVGLPLERIPFQSIPRCMPWAEYAIVNWVEDTLSIELRRVPIDLDAVKQAALDNDMPRAALWIEQWMT